MKLFTYFDIGLNIMMQIKTSLELFMNANIYSYVTLTKVIKINIEKYLFKNTFKV